MMGEGFQFLDIVFFALVAGFILLRLRQSLGKRTGNERKPPIEGAPGVEPEGRPDNVIPLPGRPDPAGAVAEASLEPGVASGVAAIRKLDSSFAVAGFLAGARAAYEMIVHSFSVGDADTLRPLLSTEVYGNFAAEIERREKAGESLENTVVTINGVKLLEARLDERTAEVTVEFRSEMISITRNAKGEVVDGDPRVVRNVIDIWTFARNLRSNDPNWLLIKTRTGEA